MSKNPRKFNPDGFDPDNITGKYILKYRKPVSCPSLMKWAKWLEQSRRGRTYNCRVRVNYIGIQKISTVFLGLDHNFQDGPPLLFETMVFNSSIEIMERCSTWKQALKQHWNIVKLVKEQGKEVSVKQ